MKVNSSRPSNAQQEARKLFLAATHEAAHAVIAELLTGEKATIAIERCSNDDGAFWYSGRTEHAMANDGEARLMIALSGGAAEAIVDGHRYDFGTGLFRAIMRRVSAADARHAGPFIDERAVDRCLALVVQHEAAIAARAKLEISAFASASRSSLPLPRSGQPPAEAGGLPEGAEHGDRQVSYEALRITFGPQVAAVRSARLAFDDLVPRSWASEAARALGVPIAGLLRVVEPVEVALGIALTPTRAVASGALGGSTGTREAPP